MADLTCLNNLIGLKQLCADSATQPLFYLDDIEGIDQQRLAQLANVQQGSGKVLAQDIIDSAIRLMLADIDSVIPSQYRLTQQLTNACSSCNWSGFYQNASTLGTGIIIKNISGSKFSNIIISNLTVMVNSSGTFTLTITDGITPKTVEYAYTAGQQVIFSNVNYTTSEKQVKIFFNDSAVSLAQIICPTKSGCGCGQRNTLVDYVITGYNAGIEATQQYGILPCVTIACSYDAIVCQTVNTSPRIFGLALLYLSASKIFENNAQSQRVNRTASFDQEYKKTDSEKFYDYYRERLVGKPAKGILGITQVVNNNLALMKDKCVICSSNPFGTAWATG